MAKITQSNREIAIVTPLGEDVLLLGAVDGHEALSQPFELRLDLASQNHEIKAKDLVGQNVTIRLEIAQGTQRYFNGFVSRFVQAPAAGDLAQYHATVVPWLWFLTRTADCRIFQNLTTPEIVKQVFRGHGFTDFEDTLTGSYPTREYCVQYRETDFNFISRLMEQEGIYYFFKHENGRHALVLADAASIHEPYPDYDEISCQFSGTPVSEREYISKWLVETRVQPGSCALNDFDFKNTKKPLQARARVQREHNHSDFEVYDYPGQYTESSDAEEYARTRIQELQTQYEVVSASADVRGICTGCTFDLVDHPRGDQNRPYLITSAHYNIDGGEFSSGGHGSAACVYACDFSAIDATQQFRPSRATHKPSVPGPQTAMVVGPSGEEVFTDEYGRVKVKFHWDRYSKADENSSCWIRVAQVWAGKTWGAMYMPRIGQEVIVEFLEGDPDRPIITGRVYNAQAMPPYDPKTNGTVSTIKSNSSKGGQGFNEIRFEDKKGEEQIFIHGEKNIDVRVKNDRFETVGKDRHLHVEKDKFEQVDNNRNEVVDADHKEQIGKDRHLRVKGKEAKQVDKSLSLTVKGDAAEVFKKNHSEQTTKDYYLKAQNVVIEGMQNITLCVGGSYIAIEQASIEIKTNGQLKLDGMTVDVKGKTKTTVQGSAMTEIKGGIVKIN